jgi:transmembrane sensor
MTTGRHAGAANHAEADATCALDSAAESLIETTIEPYRQALGQHFPSREQLLSEARLQTERQRRRRSRTLSAAGTSLAIAAITALWLIDPAWRSEELRTAVGERSSATLSDGSRVQINTGTVLRLHSHLRSRRIALVQGEALFTVAQGWQPFTVHAPGVVIRDIGTEFNVRVPAAASPGGVQVTVLEGLVEISPDSASPAAAAPSQRVNAGQTWSAQMAGAGQVSAAADAARAVAWQRGKLAFDATPLAEALAEVQRHRRAPIRVLDERAAKLRLSGEYDIAGIEALIDALPATLPVQVARAADGSVAVSSRR